MLNNNKSNAEDMNFNPNFLYPTYVTVVGGIVIFLMTNAFN